MKKKFRLVAAKSFSLAVSGAIMLGSPALTISSYAEEVSTENNGNTENGNTENSNTETNSSDNISESSNSENNSPDSNTETENTEGDASSNEQTFDNIAEYEEAVNNTIADANIPEGTEPTVDENGSTVYEWTDDDIGHKLVISETSKDDEDSSATVEVAEGSTEEITYDEPVLDHVDEDGTTWYRVGETITTDPSTETTTNSNESSTTTIEETVYNKEYSTVIAKDEQGNELTTPVYVYDAQNQIVELGSFVINEDNAITDKSGNVITVCDKDGNIIESVFCVNGKLTDAEGNAITLYNQDGEELPSKIQDAEGNDIEIVSVNQVMKDGKPVYIDKDGAETDKATDVIVTPATDWTEATEDEYNAAAEDHRKTDSVKREGEYEDCEATDEGAELKPGTGTTRQVTDAGIYKDDATLAEIKSILGDYGLTANNISVTESQTNLNVGKVTGAQHQVGTSGGVTVDQVDGKDVQGTVMRIEDIEEGVTLGLKNNVSEVILGDAALKDQIEFKEQTASAKITVDAEEKVEDIIDAVAELAEVLLEKGNYQLKDDVDLEEAATKAAILERYPNYESLSEKEKNEALVELGLATRTEVTLQRYHEEGGLHSKQELDFTGIANDSVQQYDVVYATVSLTTNEYDKQVSSSVTVQLDQAALNQYLQDHNWNMPGYYWSQQSDADKQAYVNFINENGLGTATFIPAETKHVSESVIGNCNQDGYLYIYKNDNQIVVVNVDTSSIEDENGDATSEIDLWKFTVDVNGTKTDGASGDGKKVTQELIWNFGDFNGMIVTKGSVFGTIIAPKATIVMKSSSSGQLVANTYTGGSGEWHYTGSTVKTTEVTIDPEYQKPIYDLVYYVKKDTTETVDNTPLYEAIAKKLETVTKIIPETVTSVIKFVSPDEVIKAGGEKHTTYKLVKEDPKKPPVTPPGGGGGGGGNIPGGTATNGGGGGSGSGGSGDGGGTGLHGIIPGGSSSNTVDIYDSTTPLGLQVLGVSERDADPELQVLGAMQVLPQTGLMWLPIPLMFLGGAACLGATGKKEEEED